MSYAKLHTSLLTSSLWTEDTETRIVWITLLCLADKHGEVQASIPGLAKIAGVSLEGCEKAISKFLSPDKYSRSKVMEGRRLQEIDGGWEIITYAKHRAMASKEDEKEKAAERQQRFRERNATVTPSNVESRQVTDSNAPSRPVTENRDIADADADANKEEKNMSGRPDAPIHPKEKPEGYHKDTRTVLHWLNQHSGKAFREVDANLTIISERLREPGVDLEGVKLMIERQCKLWKNDFKMADYMRPSTLFRRSNFDGYYASRFASVIIEKHPTQGYGQPPVKRPITETDRFVRQQIEDGILRVTADGKIEAVPIEELSKTKP